ncbi:MAG: ParB/RepB/Spo0J family partition protein [Bacteroidota bacterium]
MAKKLSGKRTKAQIGRGINALLSSMETPEEVVKELSNTVAMIPIQQIEVNPFQPRKEFDEEALGELADSLKVHGLIQPITVRRLNDKAFQLISGERRLRASKLAGLEEIPTYIRLANDQEMIEMALVENIQRENLNAVEVAITYQRLIEECDLTHEALADRVGKSRVSITNFLRLLKLPPDIQKALKEGILSMGHARALAGVEDLTIQNVVFKEVIEKELSVRATEKLIKSYREPAQKKNPGAASNLSGDYLSVENNLKDYLGAKVALKVKPNGSGQISIPFSSTNDLNRLLDLIER